MKRLFIFALVLAMLVTVCGVGYAATEWGFTVYTFEKAGNQSTGRTSGHNEPSGTQYAYLRGGVRFFVPAGVASGSYCYVNLNTQKQYDYDNLHQFVSNYLSWTTKPSASQSLPSSSTYAFLTTSTKTKYMEPTSYYYGYMFNIPTGVYGYYRYSLLHD